MKIYNNLFRRVASMENLVMAWDAFRHDKKNKEDVQLFEFKLEQILAA